MVDVFNTHLDHQSQVAREKSVRLIANRVEARKQPSLFLVTGDFNAGEDDPVIAYLKGKHEDPSPVPMVDSFRVARPEAIEVGTGSRFSGFTSGNKIDYIFVSPKTRVIGADILRTHRDGRYPSAH